MNYREKQLRQQNKSQITQLEQQWQQERLILQQDIINLQNSTELKLLEQNQEQIKKLEEELENNQALITEKDYQIKQLEKYPPQLELYQQKVNDLEKDLLDLAKQKLTGKKEAEKLLKELETRWKEWETRIVQEREREKEQWSQDLAQKEEQLKQTRENWQKNKEVLEEKIATLSNLNGKLNEEKNNLIFDKNSLNEKILNLNQAEEVLKNRLEELVQEHLAQLRKINVIFDEGAQFYTTIDFNGLFSLLQKVNYEQQQNSSTIKDLKNQLENTQKLVSTDKQTLVDQSTQKDWQLANCQKSAEEIKGLVDKRIVAFFGKSEVLNYCKKIIELNYD